MPLGVLRVLVDAEPIVPTRQGKPRPPLDALPTHSAHKHPDAVHIPVRADGLRPEAAGSDLPVSSCEGVLHDQRAVLLGHCVLSLGPAADRVQPEELLGKRKVPGQTREGPGRDQ